MLPPLNGTDERLTTTDLVGYLLLAHFGATALLSDEAPQHFSPW
jgi:hypothetical protein